MSVVRQRWASLDPDDRRFLDRFPEAMCASGDQRIRDIVIGRARIRINAIGEEMRTLLDPSLGWCYKAPVGHADIELTAGSGDHVEPPRWTDSTSRAEPGRVRLRGDGLLGVFDDEYEMMSFYDSRRRRGAFWCRDIALVPGWEQGTPLRFLLAWALADFGLHLVHLGCVGDAARGGVVITGKSGAGKSTTSLACVHAGMATTGDDYAALCIQSRPRLHSVFGRAKIIPDSPAGRLVDLTSAGPPRSDGKVHVVLGEALLPTMTVRAIVVPRVGERTGTPERISPREAMLGLAPSTMMQSVFEGQQLLSAVAHLSRAVPAYSLQVGPDLAEVASAIDRIEG